MRKLDPGAGQALFLLLPNLTVATNSLLIKICTDATTKNKKEKKQNLGSIKEGLMTFVYKKRQWRAVMKTLRQIWILKRS